MVDVRSSKGIVGHIVAARSVVLLILILVIGLVYVVSIVPLVQGADDATYIALARALAGGEGYRRVWQPDAPPETHFPIGFPLLLAPVLMALPEFPIRVSALLGVSVLFGLLTVPLWYTWLRSGLQVPPLQAALLTALAALNPAMLRFATQTVMSEVAYTFFSVAALFLTWRCLSRPGRVRWDLILLVLALAGACLIRMVGLALVAAVLFSLAWEQRWGKAAIVAGAVALLLTPWFYRNAQVNTGAATLDYGSDFWLKDYAHPELGPVAGPLEIVTRTATNAWSHITGVLPGIFLPNLGGDAVSALVRDLGVQWGISIIGIVLAGLMAWGALCCWQRGNRLLPAYAALYAGLILLPPWVAARNWVPLVPVLIFFLWRALNDLVGRSRSPTWRAIVVPGVLSLLLAGMLISDRHYLRLGLDYHVRGGLPPAEASLQEAWTWIRAHTPGEASIAYEFAAKVYLNTGRTAGGLPGPDEITGTRPVYLVLQPDRPAGDPYDPGEPPRLRRAVEDGHSNWYPVYRSAIEPATSVYVWQPGVSLK